MRVKPADHRTHGASRFLVRLVMRVAHIVHRIEHAAVHRLQAVAHIGKCPAHDHAHRVIEIRPAHFCFQGYRVLLFFVIHGLDIQILYVEGVLLDELSARLDRIPHQN